MNICPCNGRVHNDNRLRFDGYGFQNCTIKHPHANEHPIRTAWKIAECAAMPRNCARHSAFAIKRMHPPRLIALRHV